MTYLNWGYATKFARFFSGANSWPIMLLFVVTPYILIDSAYWPFLTYLMIGVFYLCSSVVRIAEYLFLQGKITTLLYGILRVVFGVALIFGALLAAPRPITDLSFLRMWARLLWGIGLPLLAVTIYIEAWSVYRRLTDAITR